MLIYNDSIPWLLVDNQARIARLSNLFLAT